MPENQTADFPAHAESPKTSPNWQISESEKTDEGGIDIGMPDGVAEDGFEPIKPAATTDNSQLQKLQSTSSRPVERSWSLNDGYSCNNEVDVEVNTGDSQGTEDTASSDFVVRWDENDPMNPRNFNKVRRWIIVIICSTGSLCV